MGRMILSILAGLLVGSIIVHLVEMLGHSIYPPPEGIDFNDPEKLTELVASMPIGALIMVIVGWGVGALTAGFTSAAISNDKRMMGALITGGIFMLFGLAMLILIPHPMWFSIAGMAVYIPCAYLGGKLAISIVKKETGQSDEPSQSGGDSVAE